MPVAMSRTAPVQTLLEGADLDVNASIDENQFLEFRKPVPQPVPSRVPHRVSNGFGLAVLARVNLALSTYITAELQRPPRVRSPAATHRRPESRLSRG
jgi:hypothetical protein